MSPLPDASRLRVLIFDDDALTRRALRSWIEHQPDMTVVGEAGDGVDAVRVCMDVEADVIVMDAHMPRASGLDAARTIRRLGNRTPVVVISGDAAVRRRTERLPRARFVLKGDAGAKETLNTIRDIASPS